MNFETLTNRLYEADPQIRIETLRILAMLEETRAINAIVLIYRNDPDARVREVAKWAGNIIWQAKQRGHSTEAALSAYNRRVESATNHLENLFVEDLTMKAGEDNFLRNEMDMTRAKWEQLDSLRPSTQPGATQIMGQLSARLETSGDDFDLSDFELDFSEDDEDLLDAGLRDL